MTVAERVRKHRDRKRERAALAGTTPALFDAPPPRARTDTDRERTRERVRAHRARRRALTVAPMADPERPDVDAVIAWCETLAVSQGRRAGERLELWPWERRFLRDALRPGIVEAGLTMGRGGGKSTLIAAIAAAAVAGPLRQARGDVLVVASSFLQARVVFEHSRAFLGPFFAASPADWRIVDHSQAAVVEHVPSGARLRCIGSDPRRAHGLAPALCIADEPAQWPATSGERMVAALETARGKLRASRLFFIGTRPAEGEHWFNRRLVPSASRAAVVYAADPEADPHSPESWASANPSMAFLPDLRAAIERESSEAKADPARLASFRALRLNSGVSDTVPRAILTVDEWTRIERDDTPRGAEFVLGLDVGGGAAQTAAARCDPWTGRLEAVAAFPGVPSLDERGRRDGVGSLYERMAARGELLVIGDGRAVDLTEFLGLLLDRWGAPACVVADRWHAAELQDALGRAGYPVAEFVLRGQGWKDGAEDVREFRRECLAERIHPVPSLLLRAAIRESRVASDPAGNQKLAKQSEGGRRARARDDALAAAIVGIAECARERRRRGL